MARADGDQLRLCGAAVIDGERTPRRERAARRERGQGRWCTGDRHKARALRRVESWHRSEKACGVGHPAVAVEVSDRGHLDGAAGVHDQGAVGELGDHPEVVGDDQHAGTGHVACGLEHIEDLRLHGDIERGRRLVTDQ